MNPLIQNSLKVGLGFFVGIPVIMIVQAYTYNPWILSAVQLCFFTGFYTLCDTFFQKLKK